MSISAETTNDAFGNFPASDQQRRVALFCSQSGPTIFRAIVHPTDVWTPDPFDVETIHEEARDAFIRLLDRVTNRDSDSKKGEILLLKGESGSGKTHLMRAFRTHTHRLGLGYFGYMQMTSASSNYSRYMLHKLIDSLDKPYYRSVDAPDETTGLMQLAEAVVESRDISTAELETLRESDLSQHERNDLIDRLTNRLLHDPRFSGQEQLFDLLRAMLLLQCGDVSVRARVMKYLRGERLSDLDLQRLSGISPLDPESGPEELLQRLGQLMWSAHRMGIVLCVDQLEGMYRADQSGEAANRFRAAMQGLVTFAEHVPTTVVVIACLEDYYAQLHNFLDKSYQDRIERDPSALTLVANRTSEEVEQLAAAHLRHLFEEVDVPFDECDPISPIPRESLEAQAGKRTRDVLEWCRSYREACVAAGHLIGECKPDDGGGPDFPADSTDLEQAWNDFLAGDLPTAPDDEDELAALLDETVHCFEEELPESHRFDTDRRGRMLDIIWIQGNREADRMKVGICNRRAPGGWLANQVTEVTQAADEQEPAAKPIIVRSTDFPKSPRAQISRQLGKLIAGGGRRVVVPDTDWRTMLAMTAFRRKHQSNGELNRWLKQTQPLSQLKCIQDLFALGDSLPFDDTEGPDTPGNGPTDPPPIRPSNGGRPPSGQVTAPGSDSVGPAVVTDPQSTGGSTAELLVGRSRRRNSGPVTLLPHALKRHAAFLGGTGSGKTTAALNLIEQLLLRGVPALFVDRKGDLARYAMPDVWTEGPADLKLIDRQQALRDVLHIDLYTPGRIDGRPITLPIVPERFQEMNSADRQQIARHAAQSLAAMMGYGPTGSNASRTAILVKAIELLAADLDRVTLQSLIDCIHNQDPGLINAIGVLQSKLFERLVDDLQTLQINRASLFPETGDALDAEALFGLGSHRISGKTQLSIISTKFLGSHAEVQFWVAQLLLELGRWMSKNPSDGLQAVVLLDEADLYLPAVGKPATKEPMENLLKRARSAGLGIMLATQSPGDFDYKCRENINAWFIGKIKEDTAIKKMQPMLSECKQNVSAELPRQEAGEFFLVQSAEAHAIQSDRSAIETEQVPEDQILEYARASKSDRSEKA